MKWTLFIFTLSSVALPATGDLRFENGWPVLRAGSQIAGRYRETAAIDLQIDNAHYPAPSDPRKADATSVRYETAVGMIADTIAPLPGMPGAFRRTVRFTNRTSRTLDLTGATFRAAFKLAAGAPQWAAQSIVMAQQAGGWTAAAAFSSMEDVWRLRVQQEAGGIVVAHASNTAWRLPPGAEAEIGSQYLWGVNAPLEAAKKTTQDWYRALGLAAPRDLPGWIHDAVLYEACAGGTLDSHFGDLGGFDNLAKHIDYLSDVGFNSMWLLNPLTHKDPANPRDRWNPYDQLGYEEIDAASGGAEALGRLMRVMRQHEFHVLCEIVPHGGQAEVAKNPDWWTYERDGSRRARYGQGLDYSAPGWQQEIRKTVRWLTEKFGFDGWRIDVADGYGINWRAKHNLPHVSKSTMAGGIGMLRAVRGGAIDAGVNPVLLPETHVARPEYAPVSGLDYGFPLKFRLQRDMLWTLSPEGRVRNLREFFKNEQYADAPGTVHLRAPDNHDTAGGIFGSGEDRFGIGLYRALLGVCSVVDGFPMVYQGQERGSYEHLRRIYAARRQTPELRRGRCDYDAVTGPPEVFAVLRSLEGRYAIGLVNLSGKTTAGQFLLPGYLSGGVRDAVSGRKGKVNGKRLEWRLAPYETAVLRFGDGVLAPPPPERHRAESMAVPPSASDGTTLDAYGLHLKFVAERAVVRREPLAGGAAKVRVEGEPGARVRLEVDGVDRWYVQSIAGLYSDRLLRRHYPWPGGRYKWEPNQIGGPAWRIFGKEFQPDRLWQSALAPLIADGAVALAGPQGGGIRISQIRTNARNIVLADSSMGLSGTTAEREDRYRCRLELLAQDKHTNPKLTHPYLGRIWNVIHPPGANERLQAELVIAPSERIRLEDLDGYELPELGRASREFRNPNWTWALQRFVTLDEPNQITWRRLPLDRSAEYTLFLALEYRGESPDAGQTTTAYTITFDGRRRSWSWEALNAVRPWGTRMSLSWARVPLGYVAAGEHELKLETSLPGVSMGEDLFVSSDAGFHP